MAIYWPTPGLKGRTFKPCVLTRWDFNFCVRSSPLRVHVVGMLRLMSDINQPSLPTPFCSVLVSISVFTTISTVFRSINSPDNSPLSHSFLPVLNLALLALCTKYFCMKVSFSRDIIPSGWLGSKHQLTNSMKFSLGPDVILCGWLGLKHQLTN